MLNQKTSPTDAASAGSTIRCSGGCGGAQASPKAAEDAGWSFLHITGRYRCGQCEGELYRASNLAGSPPDSFVDELAKDSIGALKKLREPPPLHEKVSPR